MKRPLGEVCSCCVREAGHGGAHALRWVGVSYDEKTYEVSAIVKPDVEELEMICESLCT